MFNLFPDLKKPALFDTAKASTKADFTDFSNVFAFACIDSYNELRMMALFDTAKDSILANMGTYPNAIYCDCPSFFGLSDEPVAVRHKRKGKRRRNKFGW